MMKQFEVWKIAGRRALVVSDRPYYDTIWGFWRQMADLGPVAVGDSGMPRGQMQVIDDFHDDERASGLDSVPA